ncbi:MAG: hypothetical protein ABIQ62_05710, partial [Thermomonas sp.]
MTSGPERHTMPLVLDPQKSLESAPEDESPPVATEYKFSHVTTGRYLPTPGKAPGWPFTEIGHWKIDVNASAEDW